MQSLKQKLGWPPTRQQAVWAVIAIAAVVSAAVATTSGALTGITLLLGFSGVLSLILLFIPARPKIVATLRGEQNAISGTAGIGLIVGAERTVRPLDINQIVRNQEREALKTMPRAPTPKVPPGAFGGVFDLSQSTANMLARTSGAGDVELEGFMREVREYGEELRAWLEQLQQARYERLRVFSASARAQEIGQAPADFARMSLRLSDEFEEPARPPEVPEPPERPEFIGRLGAVLPRPYLAQRITRGGLSHLLHHPNEYRGVGAEYSSEDGSTIIGLNIGHINQHDHRDTAEFTLRAPLPGIYEVEWRISANGLDPPTDGAIKVEVREPTIGEPIVELADALAERKNHSLD